MARKAKQRISYGNQALVFLGDLAQLIVDLVLPLPNQKGGHRLGVNGLAIDSGKSILYVPADAAGALSLTSCADIQVEEMV